MPIQHRNTQMPIHITNTEAKDMADAYWGTTCFKPKVCPVQMKTKPKNPNKLDSDVTT